LLPSIVAPVAKLIDKGPKHALKRLLSCIVEVEVKIEERLTRRGSTKIFNDCRAKNRLTTSRNGIIASSNTLVKDASFRDSICKDTGEECICIEMEAAGLMNGFPCLIIRGICDYGDSHKNDRWQRYAAATAAAYAKEFLSVVPRGDLEKTRRAAEVLDSS
jgi:nucleoside phosphorylase